MELDEEDSHLCIRCNQTIIGLQNYVNHRQSHCRAQAKSSSKQFSPNFSFLDSHTNKKIQNYGDAFNFVDEREESDDDEDDEDDLSEVDDLSEEEDGISGEQNNKSTESEYKEYDYDFFSSLELQYMSAKRDSPQARGAGKNFNHHRIMTRKATQAALSTTQHGDEWIDDTNVTASMTTKKDDDDTYNKYYHNESNESSDSDESEPTAAAVPPRNYTRGKWKPGSRILNNFSRIEDITKASNWDLNENESSNDGHLDKSIEIDDTNPPPNHTKGKWIPGTKISRLEFKDEKIDERKERDSFWCRYCCRNLATKAIYERHLKSNLHKKRTRQQNELEDAGESLPLGNLNELSTHFSKQEQSSSLKKTPEEQTNKTTSTADEHTEIIEIESGLLDRGATSTPITRTTHDDDNDADGRNGYVKGNSASIQPEDSGAIRQKKRKKKFRSRTKVTCEECDMKLPVHLFGNHLISHFHYRKMLLNPKKSFDTVLNNFHKIVIQSPFQCQPCKFYFNTREEFTRHWNSIEHTEIVTKLVGGKFLCSSFCKFECVSNADMTEHLDSVEHQQVVTLINRSKPIIIRYITRLTCKQCGREFRYNIQLMHHARECKESTLNFKFNDTIFNCDMCDKAFQSGLSLQKHKIKAHGITIFFCSECQLTFNTADEAKAHRRTNQHKTLAARRRISNDPELRQRIMKKCPVCGDELEDIIQLKQHIHDFHPERRFT